MANTSLSVFEKCPESIFFSFWVNFSGASGLGDDEGEGEDEGDEGEGEDEGDEGEGEDEGDEGDDDK